MFHFHFVSASEAKFQYLSYGLTENLQTQYFLQTISKKSEN